MQERDELKALKTEIKMSREGKVKRKICVWKRKNEKQKNININVYERMKEKKTREREKRSGNKYMRG